MTNNHSCCIGCLLEGTSSILATYMVEGYELCGKHAKDAVPVIAEIRHQLNAQIFRMMN